MYGFVLLKILLLLFLGGAQPLSWAIRIKVAIGAARGLSFLHDAECQVIYRDVKASNILLDSVCHDSFYAFMIFVLFCFFLNVLKYIYIFFHKYRNIMRSFRILAWQKLDRLVIELMSPRRSWAPMDMQPQNTLLQVRNILTLKILNSLL